jgi:hypothetical protein
VQFRLKTLRGLIGTSIGDELHRHVIVGALAAFETYHRSAIVEIVDSGNAYTARAAETVTEKISVTDALTWFGGKSVKFSELIAHVAPFSSVTDIVSTLEKLLSCNLKNAIANAVDPHELRAKKENPSPIVSNVDELLSALGETFRLRHILAHEAAFDLKVTAAECDRLLSAVGLWIRAFDALLWATVHADVPLTNFEMRQHASRDLIAARRELAVAMRQALAEARKSGMMPWLRRNHIEWMRVTEDWFDQVYGRRLGTMWPAVRMKSLADAIQVRAQKVSSAAKSWPLLGDRVKMEPRA